MYITLKLGSVTQLYGINHSALNNLLRVSVMFLSVIGVVQGNTNYIFETNVREVISRKFPQLDKLIKDRNSKILLKNLTEETSAAIRDFHNVPK
jgi:hypothetical protein